MKKFYRTLVTVEVLTEDEPYTGRDLEDLAYEITEGHASGAISVGEPEELTPDAMSKALLNQGSDPEFLGIRTDDFGRPIGFIDGDDFYDLEGNVLDPVGVSDLERRREAAIILRQATEETDLNTFIQPDEYLVEEV